MVVEKYEIIQSVKIEDMNGIEVFYLNEINTTQFELDDNFVIGRYVA